MTSREAHSRYNRSQKGCDRYLRYEHSQKGIETRQRWKDAHPDYQVERYHRIQDETGMHGGDITGILYIHRFLKALQDPNIKVVEIKPE